MIRVAVRSSARVPPSVGVRRPAAEPNIRTRAIHCSTRPGGRSATSGAARSSLNSGGVALLPPMTHQDAARSLGLTATLPFALIAGAEEGRQPTFGGSPFPRMKHPSALPQERLWRHLDRPRAAAFPLLREGPDEGQDPPGGRHRRLDPAWGIHHRGANPARHRGGRVRLPDAAQLPTGDGGGVPQSRRGGDGPQCDRLHELYPRRPRPRGRDLRPRADRRPQGGAGSGGLRRRVARWRAAPRGRPFVAASAAARSWYSGNALSIPASRKTRSI